VWLEYLLGVEERGGCIDFVEEIIGNEGVV
jgi:hypothetical protein